MSTKQIGSLTVSADSRPDDPTIVEFPVIADEVALAHLTTWMPGAWWASLARRVVEVNLPSERISTITLDNGDAIIGLVTRSHGRRVAYDRAIQTADRVGHVLPPEQIDPTWGDATMIRRALLHYVRWEIEQLAEPDRLVAVAAAAEQSFVPWATRLSEEVALHLLERAHLGRLSPVVSAAVEGGRYEVLITLDVMAEAHAVELQIPVRDDREHGELVDTVQVYLRERGLPRIGVTRTAYPADAG